MEGFAQLFVTVAPWAVMLMIYWILQRQIDKLRNALAFFVSKTSDLMKVLNRIETLAKEIAEQ